MISHDFFWFFHDFIFWFWKLPEFSFGVSGGAFGRGSGRFLASAGGATGVPKNSSMQMSKKGIQNHFVQKLLLLAIHDMSKYWSILQYLGGWFRELHLSNLSRLESQDDRASFQWQPLMLISFWYDFGDAVCHSNLAMFLGNNLFIDKMHLTLKKCLEAFMACLSYILLESCQEH